MFICANACTPCAALLRAGTDLTVMAQRFSAQALYIEPQHASETSPLTHLVSSWLTRCVFYTSRGLYWRGFLKTSLNTKTIRPYRNQSQGAPASTRRSSFTELVSPCMYKWAVLSETSLPWTTLCLHLLVHLQHVAGHRQEGGFSSLWTCVSYLARLTHVCQDAVVASPRHR